jgi:hypothetical protein
MFKNKESKFLNNIKNKNINDLQKFENLMYTVISRGYLECIKHLISIGYEVNANYCNIASNYGHLNILKYLHENNCPWNSEVCKNAAYHGFLDILKYAHENGCEWNEFTTANASRSGNLQCLKYCYENGCQIDMYSVYFAAKKGYIKCLEYAIDKCNIIDINNIIEVCLTFSTSNYECFMYCFRRLNDKQLFINKNSEKLNTFINKNIDKLDLDDFTWREIFNYDLSRIPKLLDKVNNKKIEIENIKKISLELLDKWLHTDVIKYCIHMYI